MLFQLLSRHYISRNPHNISFEEYDRTINELFAKIKAERGNILEIHEHIFLKLAFEFMDISMSVSIEEAEKIIINGISEGGVMPNADTMLDYLKATPHKDRLTALHVICPALFVSSDEKSTAHLTHNLCAVSP